MVDVIGTGDPAIQKILDAHRNEQAQHAVDGDFSEVPAAIPAPTPTCPAMCPAWNVEAFSPKRFFDTDPAPFVFIIPGLLTKGVCGFLYGEGGTFKSLAALWLVILRAVGGIICGQKWLDRFEIPGVGRSILFSGEDVDADLHHRVKHITTSIQAERPDIPPSIIHHAISENCLIVSREQWVSDGELFFVDEQGKPTAKYAEIVRIVQEFGADLVILETFSRITNVDEIDNQMGARVVGAMEALRDATGATVLVIAHTSKAARGGQTDTHGQNGLRGAGALMDNSRFGLWFKAMAAVDGQACFEVAHAKAFRGMRVETFRVLVDYPMFSVLKKPTAPNIFDLVVEDVRSNPGTTQRQTIERLGGRRLVINQAFRDAVAEGLIVQKTRKDGYFMSDVSTFPDVSHVSGKPTKDDKDGGSQNPPPPSFPVSHTIRETSNGKRQTGSNPKGQTSTPAQEIVSTAPIAGNEQTILMLS